MRDPSARNTVHSRKIASDVCAVTASQSDRHDGAVWAFARIKLSVNPAIAVNSRQPGSRFVPDTGERAANSDGSIAGTSDGQNTTKNTRAEVSIQITAW